MSDLKYLALGFVALALSFQYVAAFMAMSNNAEVAPKIQGMVYATSSFIEFIALIIFGLAFISR